MSHEWGELSDDCSDYEDDEHEWIAGVAAQGRGSDHAEAGAPTEVVCLLDLPKELLAAVAAHLPEDDELAASLACRQLREAVVASEHRDARARRPASVAQVFGGLRPKRMSTSIRSAFNSRAKLQWALTRGLKLDDRLLSHAAAAGQLEPLRWLRAQGCAWPPPYPSLGDSPCSSAAEGGHLSVLQWARADGCPWDETTCASAARGKHWAVLEWACANGCPGADRPVYQYLLLRWYKHDDNWEYAHYINNFSDRY
jgi:hypothetical protein